MTFQRGDVVLVPFPFSDLSMAKVRPAVIVSSDLYHSTEPDLLLAALTSQVAGATGPFDYQLNDWRAAGLRFPSALKPVLVTLDPARVVHRIGALSALDLARVDERLRIYHLNCGTINVWGGVAIIGTGGPLRRAPGVSHCVLAETGDGLLLIDTGLGTRDLAAPSRVMRMFLAMSGSPRDPAETACAQVRRLGYDPEEVRHVALTHFHYDHAGGLPDFPSAQVHIYRDEYLGVTQPRDLYERTVYRPEHWAHGPRWAVHDLQGDAWFGLECTPLVDLGSTAFCLVPLPGHTRGHCGVALRTDDGWLLHCGDAYAFHGDVDLVHPRRPPYLWLLWPIVYANKAFRQIGKHAPRLRALLRAHGDQVRLTCTHDPHDYLAFM